MNLLKYIIPSLNSCFFLIIIFPTQFDFSLLQISFKHTQNKIIIRTWFFSKEHLFRWVVLYYMNNSTRSWYRIGTILYIKNVIPIQIAYRIWVGNPNPVLNNLKNSSTRALNSIAIMQVKYFEIANKERAGVLILMWFFSNRIFENKLVLVVPSIPPTSGLLYRYTRRIISLDYMRFKMVIENLPLPVLPHSLY